MRKLRVGSDFFSAVLFSELIRDDIESFSDRHGALFHERWHICAGGLFPRGAKIILIDIA